MSSTSVTIGLRTVGGRDVDHPASQLDGACVMQSETKPASRCLRECMAAAGKPASEAVLLQPLPVEDDERLASRLGELAALA